MKENSIMIYIKVMVDIDGLIRLNIKETLNKVYRMDGVCLSVVMEIPTLAALRRI